MATCRDCCRAGRGIGPELDRGTGREHPAPDRDIGRGIGLECPRVPARETGPVCRRAPDRGIGRAQGQEIGPWCLRARDRGIGRAVNRARGGQVVIFGRGSSRAVAAGQGSRGRRRRGVRPVPRRAARQGRASTAVAGPAAAMEREGEAAVVAGTGNGAAPSQFTLSRGQRRP
jgi:hypothetical protein